jgi:hypothetical protein
VEALNGGLPPPLKNFPYALVCSASQLFAGLNDGSIYVSHDLGDSWKALLLIGEALPSILAMAYV